jgi:PAS domain S-box-containing protein
MACGALFQQSIAARLILLVAVIAAPLVGLQLYYTVNEANSARNEALDRSLSVARSVQGRIDDHIHSVDSLLLTMAATVPARRDAIEQGHATLRRIKSSLPDYFDSISVLESDGTMLYSAEMPPPLPGSIKVGDQGYFKEAISTGALAASNPIVSRTSDKRLLVFARSIPDDKTGTLRGVVSASTLLDRFQHIFAQEQLPRGSVITLLDQNGIVLARSSDPEKWIGVDLSEVASAKAAIQAREGVRQLISADGVTRLSGFTKLHQMPWLVYVGIPSDAALADSRAHVLRLMLLTIAVSVLAIGVAGWIARGIARPLGRLARDAAELASGNLSHRSMVAAHGEVGRLAASFNTMAGAVELQRIELAASEARARATFEQAAVGIAHTAPDGRLLLVNQRLCDIVGYTREELLAIRLQDLIHPDDLEGDRAFSRRLLAAQMPSSTYMMEMRYLRKDGKITWIKHTVALVHTESGAPDYFISVVEDINERKKSEALIAGQKQVFETMARNAPLQETLALLLRVIEAQFSEMLCSVLLLDPDGIHLRHGAAPSMPDEYMHAIDGASIGPQAGSCGTAAFLGERIIVDDIAHDPRWANYRELALAHGLRACWSTPILNSAGHVLGTFAIYYRVPCRPTAQHLELIEIVTYTAAIAISRTHVEAERERLLLEVDTAHKEAVTARDLLQQVMASSPVGITVVRRDGRIALANPAAQRILCLTGDEITQRVYAAPDWKVAKADGTPCLREELPFERVMASARPLFDAEYSVELPDARRILISVNAAPLQDESGELDGVVVVVSDISARKRAEAQILKLNVELEQRVVERTAQLEVANKELEAFSYLVSHDLKAPLRGIDGYSQFLEEDFNEALGEEGLAFVRNIRRGADQMHELIEDLLAYSRIERRNIENAELNLPACIQAVTQGYAQEVAERGVVLSIDVPELTVHADWDGLAIVLRNLLDNALKFSRDARPPAIEIGASSEAGKVILRVRDNGIGFDMKFHDRIFEIFSRLQRSEDYSGTGVGLALVRKAMQRMGGRVWAQSAPGKGTTFFLELSA